MAALLQAFWWFDEMDPHSYPMVFPSKRLRLHPYSPHEYSLAEFFEMHDRRPLVGCNILHDIYFQEADFKAKFEAFPLGLCWQFDRVRPTGQHRNISADVARVRRVWDRYSALRYMVGDGDPYEETSWESLTLLQL